MPTSAGNKLRIAQVAPLWTPIPPSTYGGIELLLALLCDELVARGHEVTLFASGDCRTSAKLRAVIPVNLGELMSRGDALMYEYYMNAAMAAVLAAQDEFDVVHCHLPPAWLPFAAAMRTPCTFTLHTSPHTDDEWAMRNFPGAHVVAISHAQVAAASSRLGRKFPVVYNGVEFARYDASFEPGRYLAFLGRMSREKNPLDAIRIAQAANMPIVLAGRPQNAAEEAYFRDEVQPHIDGTRVRWIGLVNHPQKVELLRNAAALVFPIQWDEPFGLVMIEAMACGAPVLAVRRGSVAEVVDEGVTGFTAATPGELGPLVVKACALDRRKVREHAASRFSHAKMVDDYLAHYRSLIANLEGAAPSAH
ncbi:MAG: glycosyltransferase family 4 protein [Chthoniobacteraceae bacterium]